MIDETTLKWLGFQRQWVICPQSSVISIMRDIDIGIDGHDIGVCHRIGKPEGKSKKTIVRFRNHKISKKAFKKKFASV